MAHFYTNSSCLKYFCVLFFSGHCALLMFLRSYWLPPHGKFLILCSLPNHGPRKSRWFPGLGDLPLLEAHFSLSAFICLLGPTPVSWHPSSLPPPDVPPPRKYAPHLPFLPSRFPSLAVSSVTRTKNLGFVVGASLSFHIEAAMKSYPLQNI